MEGLEGVLDALKRLPPEIVSKNGGPVKAALRKAAQVIQGEWKLNLQRIIDTPNIGGQDESTGLYMQNIVVTRGRMPSGLKGERMVVRVRNKQYPGLKGKGSTTAANARRLEYGTERRRPYPHIRPAFDAKKGEALDTFVREVTTRTNKVIAKLERAAKRAARSR